MMKGMAIREAAGTLDLVQARELFAEYAQWLGVDLSFQNFSEELDSLPGAYARPRGRLLLADVDGQAAGCAALREFDAHSGEIKRLWVRPAFRHRCMGRLLVKHLIEAAQDIGYRRLLLDTLPPMAAAQALYRSFRFREIPAYYHNPIPGAAYFALALEPLSAPAG
jgi:carbonic anhydrase